MGVYVDAEDLRQHFRRAGSMDDETIEEVMQEQESYVKERLKIDVLPPNNDILKNIIRDLTVSAAILSAPASTVDDVAKADRLRSEALRRLTELIEDGFKAGTPSNKNVDTEIYNPYEYSFFSPSEFFLE